MKIGFLITARLKSTRLPLKLLLDLNGRTIVERVIDRCKKVKDISEIVLCTSTNPQDKPLVDISKDNDIHYYMGSSLDVLQRLSDASEFYGLDYIINITGENPLFSIYHANIVVDQAKREKNDFIYIDGLPIGCAVYGLRPEAIRTVCEIKKDIDTEIWGPFINRPEIFNVYKVDVDKKLRREKLRLTADYIEDYELLQLLYSHYPEKEVPSYFEVLSRLKKDKSLLKINEKRHQLTIDEEVLEKLEIFFKDNNESIIEIKKKYYNCSSNF